MLDKYYSVKFMGVEYTAGVDEEEPILSIANDVVTAAMLELSGFTQLTLSSGEPEEETRKPRNQIIH